MQTSMDHPRNHDVADPHDAQAVKMFQHKFVHEGNRRNLRGLKQHRVCYIYIYIVRKTMINRFPVMTHVHRWYKPFPIECFSIVSPAVYIYIYTIYIYIYIVYIYIYSIYIYIVYIYYIYIYFVRKEIEQRKQRIFTLNNRALLT